MNFCTVVGFAHCFIATFQPTSSSFYFNSTFLTLFSNLFIRLSILETFHFANPFTHFFLNLLSKSLSHICILQVDSLKPFFNDIKTSCSVASFRWILIGYGIFTPRFQLSSSKWHSNFHLQVTFQWYLCLSLLAVVYRQREMWRVCCVLLTALINISRMNLISPYEKGLK